jgi:hypothetical protein
MLLVIQNSAKPFNIYFGEAGLTVTATLSKNGGSFNAVSPTITDRSNGYYSITPLAAHRDTIGENAWLFSASGQSDLPRVEQVGLADVDVVAVGANTVAPDNAGITANGVAISALPTAIELRPLIYVAKTGNDSNSGLTFSSAKLTLTAAKNAATAGTLVKVGPGTYDESNLAKNGVDWYFARGSYVNYTGSTAIPIFSDNGSAMSFSVYGYGKFRYADSDSQFVSENRAILALTGASTVWFEALELVNETPYDGPNSSTFVLENVACKLFAKIENDITSLNYDGIVVYSGKLNLICNGDIRGADDGNAGSSSIESSGDVYVEAVTLYRPIDVLGGTCVANVKRIEGGDSHCVYADGGDALVMGAVLSSSSSLEAGFVYGSVELFNCRYDIAKVGGNVLTQANFQSVPSRTRTELAAELSRIDVATSTRLADSQYTAPDNEGITANGVAISALPEPLTAEETQAAVQAAIDAQDTNQGIAI